MSETTPKNEDEDLGPSIYGDKRIDEEVAQIPHKRLADLAHWKTTDVPNIDNIHPDDVAARMPCGHLREDWECPECGECQGCGDCSYCSDCDSHNCTCDE